MNNISERIGKNLHFNMEEIINNEEMINKFKKLRERANNLYEKLFNIIDIMNKYESPKIAKEEYYNKIIKEGKVLWLM